MAIAPPGNKSFNFNDSLNFTWKELTLKNVTYKYPRSKKAALKNVNLQIKKGLHYGFVGFSGAGKSSRSRDPGGDVWRALKSVRDAAVE